MTYCNHTCPLNSLPTITRPFLKFYFLFKFIPQIHAHSLRKHFNKKCPEIAKYDNNAATVFAGNICFHNASVMCRVFIFFESKKQKIKKGRGLRVQPSPWELSGVSTQLKINFKLELNLILRLRALAYRKTKSFKINSDSLNVSHCKLRIPGGLTYLTRQLA